MKDQHKKALYVIILIFLFGMIGGFFCYFLGKTDTLAEAFSEFRGFGMGLFPVFIIAFFLVIRDIRKLNRKAKEQ